MEILVLYDTDIKAWLVGESIESVELHIQNGYPELLEGYKSGIVKAKLIKVPDEDAFRPDLYFANGEEITRKEVL